MQRSVLVVDDDYTVAHHYEKALSLREFRVLICSNVDNAIEYIENDHFDVIILDIMMSPGTRYKDRDKHPGHRTGLYVYNDIRTTDPNIPILVLTNVTNQDTLQKFDPNPCLEIRQKMEMPPRALVNLVEEMINRVPTMRQLGDIK
jgi:DNA-binding response OmpR family regulator